MSNIPLVLSFNVNNLSPIIHMRRNYNESAGTKRHKRLKENTERKGISGRIAFMAPPQDSSQIH